MIIKYEIRDDDTNEKLAFDLTLAQVGIWWEINEDHYFGIGGRVVGGQGVILVCKTETLLKD